MLSDSLSLVLPHIVCHSVHFSEVVAGDAIGVHQNEFTNA